jgi:hypothetical protein
MKQISKALLLAAIFTFCAAYVSVQPARASQIFRPPMQSGQTITCSSDDGNRHYCNVDTRSGVRLSRQISGSACVQTRSWGYDSRGIWVDRGCRAEFVIGGGRDRDDGRGWDRGQIITCSSDDGGRNYCPLPRGVDPDSLSMSRQISGSPCIPNRTWGVDRRGLWVDRGCRAEFAIRSGRDREGGRGWDRGQIITCSSDNGGRNYCPLPRGVDPDSVNMSRQISGSPCIPNRTWGIDRRGLWVDRGCRAEFQVNRR